MQLPKNNRTPNDFKKMIDFFQQYEFLKYMEPADQYY